MYNDDNMTICSFGNGGKCINGLCICSNNYRSDMSFTRKRDCSLPLYVVEFLHIYTIVASIFCLYVSGTKFINSVGAARHILIVCILYSLGLLCYGINQLITKHILNQSGILLISFVFFMGFAFSYLALYSLLSPLYKMAEVSEEKMIKMLKIEFFFFRILNLCLIIPLAFIYGDSNVIANDLMWNYLIVSCLGSASIELIIIYIGVTITCRRMIYVVQVLIERTPENPAHITTKLYLSKLKTLTCRINAMSPILIFGWLYHPVAFITLKFVPYAYVAYFLLFGSNPFIIIIFASYATREKPQPPKVPAEILSSNPNPTQDDNVQNHINYATVEASNLQSLTSHGPNYNDSRVSSS